MITCEPVYHPCRRLFPEPGFSRVSDLCKVLNLKEETVQIVETDGTGKSDKTVEIVETDKTGQTDETDKTDKTGKSGASFVRPS